MSKHIPHIIIAAAISYCSMTLAHAQDLPQDSILLRNSGFVSDEDAWLTGGNAAGLTRYHRDNLSWAEVYGSYGYGGFVNYDESPRDLRLGADVRSFYRLSQRTVTYGRIGYDNAGLHDMTGSVFIQPERYPFNIVEDSLANPGKVHQDTYHLTGGFGTDIWQGYSLGAKVDFTAANAAKYKDLRHKNKLMDIDATFGIYLPLASWLDFGADYRYQRHSESLAFSTYGRTEVTYMSLIEYGGMMGMVEQFDNDGLTGKSFEQPLFYDGHGYGIQAELRLAPGLTWRNTWDMSYLKGYYGKETPYNIVYMRHHTHRYLWTTRFQYRTPKSLHNLDASIENEKLANWQNQYRLTTNDKDVRYYEYFQPQKTADKVWVNTHIGYTGYFSLRDETPVWQLSAGTDISYRKLTAYLYPYYRRQHWTSTEGYVNGRRNFFLDKGILTVGAGFSYKKGSGELYDDGTFVMPSDLQSPPAEMTAFLHREYCYIMSPQYVVNLMAEYAFIMPGTNLKSYARADYSYRHCNTRDEWLQGRMHWTAGVTLGVDF